MSAEPRAPLSRSAWSWAFYDWANSAFATTVMAGFFPIFFKSYWQSGVDAVTSTFRLGLANSLGSLVLVLIAPWVGAIADRLGHRKGALFAFAFLGICSCTGLFFISQELWWLAASCYAVAIIGFSGSNLFYDALLGSATGRRQLERVSALGFALGYLGGGLLFLVNVLMTQYPAAFGLDSAASAVRWSFLTVAAWWAAFSLPMLLYVEEPDRTDAKRACGICASAWRRVIETVRSFRQYPEICWFLFAYWLYIDGVNTIIRMAVDYGLALGFESTDMIKALLLTQFVGFPATLLFGAIGTRWGPKKGVLLALAVYVGVSIWGAGMTTVSEFYGLAVAIGLVQGGVQSLSRVMYVRLIPRAHAAEFFGFYSVLGKMAAVLGPFMVGAIAAVTESSRLGMASIIVLLVAGGLLLLRVADQPQSGAA